MIAFSYAHPRKHNKGHLYNSAENVEAGEEKSLLKPPLLNPVAIAIVQGEGQQSYRKNDLDRVEPLNDGIILGVLPQYVFDKWRVILSKVFLTFLCLDDQSFVQFRWIRLV